MFNNYYPYCFNINYLNRGNRLNEIIDDIKHSKDTVILYEIEVEPRQKKLDYVTKIKNQCSDKKIIWIFQKNNYIGQEAMFWDLNIEHYFLDLSLIQLYLERDIFKSSTFNNEWIDSADKFLFLTGKPDKPNRIGLLYQYYKNNLLDECIWSLFYNDEIFESSKKILPDLSNEEYNDFYKTHINNPDDIKAEDFAIGGFHCDGFPMTKELYEQTSFRVIAETWMSGQPIISEKTWAPILNNQPFIMAGLPNNLKMLKDIGFKTFTEYLPHPNYDEIYDVNERFNQIIENTKFWVEKQWNTELIRKDIEYNNKKLHSMIDETAKIYRDICSKINTTQYEIFRIIPIYDTRSKWINFYYGIKDNSWPDCYTFEQFDKLPDYIKDECIETYGLDKSNY